MFLLSFLTYYPTGERRAATNKQIAKFPSACEKCLASHLSRVSEQDLIFIMDGDSALKETYDLIVLGTGLVQSLVAGAVALTGRKVMHIDKNDFYGEYNSSHSIESFPAVTVPQGASVGYVINDECKNLLYFSQEKLPRLQPFLSSPTNFRRKKQIFQAQKKFPVGSIVDVAPFGLGFISEYIISEAEGTTQCTPCAKIFVEWFLADGKPATMYVPLCKLTKPFYGRNIETGSFGAGKLWKMRNEDRMMCVRLKWKLANGNDVLVFLHQKRCFRTFTMQNLYMQCIGGTEISQVNNFDDSSLEKLFQKSNRFCLDIIPSLLLSRGVSVDDIVKSGVSNYLEFKPIDDVWMLKEASRKPPQDLDNGQSDSAEKSSSLEHVWSGAFKKVPCSKSDVFTSPELSMSDKRLLMKFLRYCMDLGEEDALTLNEKSLAKGRSLKRPQNKVIETKNHGYNEYQDRPFVDFLKDSFDISGTLANMLIYAIGLLPKPRDAPSCTTRRGITAIQRHLYALGRFGNTAFLTPLWGAGEVPQAFCRLAAVNGGIYLLRKTPLALKYESPSVNENQKIFQGVILKDGVFVRGKCAIVGSDYCRRPRVHGSVSTGSQSSLARAIIVSTQKVCDKSGKSIFVIPPNTTNIDNLSTTFVIQYDSDSCIAPKPYYVLHLSCEVSHCVEGSDQSVDNDAAIQSLQKTVKYLYGSNEHSSIVWRTYFVVHFNNAVADEWSCIENVYTLDSNTSPIDAGKTVSSGFSKSLSFQSDFEKAESIFQQLCPGEDFLSKPMPPAADMHDESDVTSQQVYQGNDDESDMSGLDIDDDLYSDDD